MFRKILPLAAALAVTFAAAALAQEEAPPEDIFLKPEEFKLSNDDAYNRVVTELFKGDVGEREVYNSPGPLRAGVPVEDVMGHKFAPPETDSWVYFVDEDPAANWGHAAKIIYVDAKNAEPREIECQFPPKMLPAFGGITKGATAEIERIKDIDWRIPHKPPLIDKYPFGGKSKYNKYHVLISGGISAGSNYPRYRNDLKFIYHTLMNKYLGNTKDNIYVLYADGDADLDGDGANDVDYPATKANVVGVLTMLSKNLGKDDVLFVYVTNHGGYEGGKDCYICLYYGESIKDDEFAALINKIQAGQMKFVFEQCFSGGMIDDLQALSGKNLSVATACEYNKSSYGAEAPPGYGSDGYDEFVYWWTAAMFGAFPPASLPGTHPATPDPASADADGDGKVTVKEAFDFAKASDRRSEKPQYYSTPAEADSWTLCKTKECGCGSTTKAEAAALTGLFFSSYAIVLIRRRRRRRKP